MNPPPRHLTAEQAAPLAGLPVSVKDLFDIAGQPTPEQFRARYPDVQLVLPGTIATKEASGRASRSR